MTFWQSIKTGFQNGNIAKWTQAIGMTSFGIGFTGAMIHDLNKSSNCCCGGSIFNGMLGYNSMMGYNPMMSLGCGGNMFGMYNPMMSLGCGGNMFGMFGGYNNYGSQYGQYMAAQAGAMDFQMFWNQYQAQQAQMAQSTTQSVVNEKMDNECASKIAENQSTDLGTKFENGTAALFKENDAKDSFKLCNLNKNNEDSYKLEITKIGKSYGKILDKDGDGYISEEEFSAQDTKGLSGTKLSDQLKGAEIAFKKIDLNKDGKIDWKELSAAITTYDLDSEYKYDGKISKSDYNRWLTEAVKETSNKFDKALQKSYRYLFGSSEED